MKTYADMVKGFYTPLRGALGVEIAETDTVGDRPALPFASYKVLVPRIVQNGAMSGYLETFEEEGITKERKVTDVEATFSLSFYAKSSTEAWTLAGTAFEYLDYVGQNELLGRGLIVVECTNPQDRTLYLGDAYEYRVGFDVRFRVKEELVRTIVDTIEQAEIEQLTFENEQLTFEN